MLKLNRIISYSLAEPYFFPLVIADGTFDLLMKIEFIKGNSNSLESKQLLKLLKRMTRYSRYPETGTLAVRDPNSKAHNRIKAEA